MTDNAFADRLSIDDDHRELVIHLRKEIADLISVPKELLHPDDPMSTIKACYWADWEHEIILLSIKDFWDMNGKSININWDFMSRLHEVRCKTRNATLSHYIRTAVTEYEDFIKGGRL